MIIARRARHLLLAPLSDAGRFLRTTTNIGCRFADLNDWTADIRRDCPAEARRICPCQSEPAVARGPGQDGISGWKRRSAQGATALSFDVDCVSDAQPNLCADGARPALARLAVDNASIVDGAFTCRASETRFALVQDAAAPAAARRPSGTCSSRVARRGRGSPCGGPSPTSRTERRGRRRFAIRHLVEPVACAARTGSAASQRRAGKCAFAVHRRAARDAGASADRAAARCQAAQAIVSGCAAQPRRRSRAMRSRSSTRAVTWSPRCGWTATARA